MTEQISVCRVCNRKTLPSHKICLQCDYDWVGAKSMTKETFIELYRKERKEVQRLSEVIEKMSREITTLRLVIDGALDVHHLDNVSQ